MTRNWYARIATLALLALALPQEWSFATQVLLIPPALAWLVPVIVEIYVWRALEVGRDRVLAMGIFLATLTTAAGVHMAEAQGVELGVAPRILLLLAFFAAAVVAVVRLGVLRGPEETPAPVATVSAAPAARHAAPPVPAPALTVAPPPAGQLEDDQDDDHEDDVEEGESVDWDDVDAEYPDTPWGKGREWAPLGREWVVAYALHHQGRLPAPPVVAARTGWPRQQQARRVVEQVEGLLETASLKDLYRQMREARQDRPLAPLHLVG